jgi:hypothetical protein
MDDNGGSNRTRTRSAPAAQDAADRPPLAGLPISGQKLARPRKNDRNCAPPALPARCSKIFYSVTDYSLSRGRSRCPCRSNISRSLTMLVLACDPGACDIPMLRRNLGAKRLEALRDFVGEVDLTFDPDDSNWITWAPTLANDLARRKATRQDWENFYADLASLNSALPLLKGAAIFRLDDGRIAEANCSRCLSLALRLCP